MRRRAIASFFSVAILIAAAAVVRNAEPADGTSPSEAGRAVGIQMRNVHLRMGDGVALEIRRLNGRMEPTNSKQPVTLDDRNSFTVQADSAEMALSTSSLTQLLNAYVFAYPGAPLKNLSLTVKDGRVVGKGIMHKGIDLPFEIHGTLSASEDGNIRLHADKVSSEHIPFKGLMHLFGEDLSKLLKVSEAKGVRIEGDDIFLYPSGMMPPPHIKGRVTAVRIEGDNIVQVFGGEPSRTMQLPVKASNYIYHRGGILRFGKLTMTDADLEILDDNPKTPFDFSLDHYNEQLVAGYSQNTRSHGLIVHMPDYNRIAKSESR